MYTLLRQRRRRGLGHVRRKEDGGIPKDILYGELALGMRTTGHRHLRYKDVCTAMNIGVMLDSNASMEAHVLSVCKSSFIHIRNLSRIKKFVDSSSLECRVRAFITTKLDYCNSLLCVAPSTLINKLQRIQNIVARIITGHGSFEHITPVVLKSLHWLPVQQRIKFKTLVLVYKAVNNLAPVYVQ